MQLFADATKTLSIVLPAYNEDGRIQSTLLETLHYLERRRDREGPAFTYEVIVADDGSKDATTKCEMVPNASFCAYAPHYNHTGSPWILQGSMAWMLYVSYACRVTRARCGVGIEGIRSRLTVDLAAGSNSCDHRAMQCAAALQQRVGSTFSLLMQMAQRQWRRWKSSRQRSSGCWLLMQVLCIVHTRLADG